MNRMSSTAAALTPKWQAAGLCIQVPDGSSDKISPATPHTVRSRLQDGPIDWIKVSLSLERRGHCTGDRTWEPGNLGACPWHLHSALARDMIYKRRLSDFGQFDFLAFDFLAFDFCPTNSGLSPTLNLLTIHGSRFAMYHHDSLEIQNCSNDR